MKILTKKISLTLFCATLSLFTLVAYHAPFFRVVFDNSEWSLNGVLIRGGLAVVMFALKSIIHMVGDMHCPAHVRFVDFENQGKFPITFFGKKTTLHKVWDTSVLTRNYKEWGYQGYAQKLDNLSKKKIKKITEGWVEDWLEESGRDVRPHIYDVKEGDALSEEFMSWAYPLAESQAQKAGYRLAKVLNIFFK